MEFTPELLAFQGVLISTDSVQPFSKLTEKGGNEEKIKYVVENIYKHLLSENYISENGIQEHAVDKMRRFAFYIILNSDLKILNQMIELQDIDAFIWTVPTISQHLMCEIMWKANMDDFISEILMYSSPHLALQVADAFLTHFKYFQPDKCLKRLQLISESCYKFICRLHFFSINDVVEHAFNNFQKCLKYFIEIPNVQSNYNLPKDHQYNFYGLRLNSILILIRNIINHYTNLLEYKTHDFLKLYELTYEDEIILKDLEFINLKESSNNTIKKYIDDSHVALLDTCKNLMMDVSVEVFCAWSEFQKGGVSLQQNIGTICSVICPMLSKIESISDHPVLEMLQQISCKPANLLDVINETDSVTISENINKKADDSNEWIKALIYRNNVCEDATLIKHISSNLKLFTADECKRIFEFVYNHLKVNNHNEDLKILAIKVFELCEKGVKEEIVENHFNNSFLNDSLETEDFNNMSTEIFNKLIDSSIDDLSVILNVFIQNPKKIFTKIYSLAIENVKQAGIMVNLITYLKKYSTYYYSTEIESSVIIITKQTIENKLNNEKSQQNFVTFMKGLKKNKVIPESKLLLTIIMPNLHSGLLKRNFKTIFLQCKLLSEVYQTSDFLEYKAPILAMLAQVMEVTRWNFKTFEADSPPALTLAITIQSNIMKEYNNISEKDKMWLRQKLKNTTALNMFYFRQIWQPPGNNYVEVVSGIRVHQGTDKEQLQLWVTQVLCRAVVQEWYEIWDSLVPVYGDRKVLNIFHTAVRLFVVSEELNRTKHTEACINYCLECYILTIRYRFLKPPETIQQIKTVMDKLIAIENIINLSDIENVSKIFLPIFAFIAQQCNEYTRSNSGSVDDFTEQFHSKLKHKEFKDMCKNIFFERSGNTESVK